jgi:hypothetical protein
MHLPLVGGLRARVFDLRESWRINAINKCIAFDTKIGDCVFHADPIGRAETQATQKSFLESFDIRKRTGNAPGSRKRMTVNGKQKKSRPHLWHTKVDSAKESWEGLVTLPLQGSADLCRGGFAPTPVLVTGKLAGYPADIFEQENLWLQQAHQLDVALEESIARILGISTPGSGESLTRRPPHQQIHSALQPT